MVSTGVAEPFEMLEYLFCAGAVKMFLACFVSRFDVREFAPLSHSLFYGFDGCAELEEDS
jgi:hypothetical protein